MAHCCARRRRALHARIAEVLESQFAEIAESQPELLARHCTEAALIEKAARLWCKAGRQIAYALGFYRGCGAIHARALPVRALAGYGGIDPRPDRGAGRVRERSDRTAGPCGARDEIGVSSSARADETN